MVARQFPKRHKTDRARDCDLAVAPFQQCLSGLAAENVVFRVMQFAVSLGAIEGLVKRKLDSDEGIRRTRQAFKIGALLRRQNNSCRFRDDTHASLNHDSFISDSGY